MLVLASLPIISAEENAVDSKTASTVNNIARLFEELHPFLGSELKLYAQSVLPDCDLARNCGVAPIRSHRIVAEKILQKDILSVRKINNTHV